jgi:hypothetical protein
MTSPLSRISCASAIACSGNLRANEQMRLGERLQVRWDVEPEALEARVPSLIL